MKNKNSVFVSLFRLGCVLVLVVLSFALGGCDTTGGGYVEYREYEAPPCGRYYQDGQDYQGQRQWPPNGYRRVYREDVANRYYYEQNPYTNDAYRNDMYDGR